MVNFLQYVCLSVCPYVSLSVCLLVHRSGGGQFPAVCLSVCLSVCELVCVSASPQVRRWSISCSMFVQTTSTRPSAASFTQACRTRTVDTRMTVLSSALLTIGITPRLKSYSGPEVKWMMIPFIFSLRPFPISRY